MKKIFVGIMLVFLCLLPGFVMLERDLTAKQNTVMSMFVRRFGPS
jgi:hypothetical protein